MSESSCLGLLFTNFFVFEREFKKKKKTYTYTYTYNDRSVRQSTLERLGEGMDGGVSENGSKKDFFYL
jgi:hypothetical protein